ncbi:MAG: hypothetical protein WBC22_16525 [Sedimentisphaerales bacterium]
MTTKRIRQVRGNDPQAGLRAKQKDNPANKWRGLRDECDRPREETHVALTAKR